MRIRWASDTHSVVRYRNELAGNQDLKALDEAVSKVSPFLKASARGKLEGHKNAIRGKLETAVGFFEQYMQLAERCRQDGYSSYAQRYDPSTDPLNLYVDKLKEIKAMVLELIDSLLQSIREIRESSGTPVAQEKLAVETSDADLLEVARKYAGILSKSVVVFELKTSLELAESMLERFRRHGESRKMQVGHLTVYDFPSARSHLSRLQNQLVEIFLEHQKPTSRSSLIAASKAPIEALDEALADLERQAVITRNPAEDTYRLRLPQQDT
jgi:hypothetical protein